MVSARMMRKIAGALVKVTAIRIFSAEAPRAMMITMYNTSTGNDSTVSATYDSRLSTQPLK